MQRTLFITLISLILFYLPNPLKAQGIAEWQDLSIAGVDNYNRGDHQTAAENFRLALALAIKFDEGGQRLINSYFNLALVYEALDKSDEAVTLYLEAIRMQEDFQGADDPVLAVMLSKLAGLYSNRSEWSSAEPLLRRALSVREDLAGVNHPYTALAVVELGNLLISQDRHREAIVQFERAINIRVNVFGDRHRTLAHILTTSGIVYLALERQVEAETALLHSLAIWKNGAPAPRADLLRTLEQIVFLYSNSGRYSEAVPYQQEVVVLRKAHAGERTVAFAEELERYANILRFSGAVDKANEQSILATKVRNSLRP